MNEPWIERVIREAQQAGKFDDVEGAGRPIPDLDRPYDPGWWARKWAHRERQRVAIIESVPRQTTFALFCRPASCGVLVLDAVQTAPSSCVLPSDAPDSTSTTQTLPARALAREIEKELPRILSGVVEGEVRARLESLNTKIKQHNTSSPGGDALTPLDVDRLLVEWAGRRRS